METVLIIVLFIVASSSFAQTVPGPNAVVTKDNIQFTETSDGISVTHEYEYKVYDTPMHTEAKVIYTPIYLYWLDDTVYHATTVFTGPKNPYVNSNLKSPQTVPGPNAVVTKDNIQFTETSDGISVTHEYEYKVYDTPMHTSVKIVYTPIYNDDGEIEYYHMSEVWR